MFFEQFNFIKISTDTSRAYYHKCSNPCYLYKLEYEDLVEACADSNLEAVKSYARKSLQSLHDICDDDPPYEDQHLEYIETFSSASDLISEYEHDPLLLVLAGFFIVCPDMGEPLPENEASVNIYHDHDITVIASNDFQPYRFKDVLTHFRENYLPTTD
jgi:hypothetical protein